MNFCVREREGFVRDRTRRFGQLTVSWVLGWSLLFALTSSADARFMSLATQSLIPDFRSFSFATGNPTQRPDSNTPRGYTHLVQRQDSSDPKKHPYNLTVPDRKEDAQETACLAKIREMFPPVVLPLSVLDLDQARLDQREHTIVIPLKEPREKIRAIWFDTDTNTEALEIFRLLRTGKIGHVGVLSLGYRPSVFYMFYGASEEDRVACRPERVLELLGTCSECEVLEWRSLQP